MEREREKKEQISKDIPTNENAISRSCIEIGYNRGEYIFEASIERRGGGAYRIGEPLRSF